MTADGTKQGGNRASPPDEEALSPRWGRQGPTGGQGPCRSDPIWPWTVGATSPGHHSPEAPGPGPHGHVALQGQGLQQQGCGLQLLTPQSPD